MSPKQIIAEWDDDGIVREPRLMRTGNGARKLCCTLCKGTTSYNRRIDHLNAHRIMWTLVDKTDGCWLWTGPMTTFGYGTHNNNYVHRDSLIAHGGHVPYGWQVDHLCLNKRCLNPSHLEAVTGAENRRRANRQRTAARRAAA